jgi:hypothetical protein
VNDSELTPQQRAGILAWYLGRGDKLTVMKAAKLTGLTWHGARRLLCMLSMYLPICEEEGIWYKTENSC